MDTIPKFGSFKPKVKNTSSENAHSLNTPEEAKDKTSERNSSHRVEKRPRSKDRDRHHRRREHADEDRDERRRRDSRDDRHRHRDHESRSKHERSPERQEYQSSLKHERHRTRDVDQDRHKTQDRSITITPDEFEESNLFIVDRRGDSKNIEYGSLHRYSVPAYRRIGYGNLIGTPLSSKIDRDASGEKEVALMNAVLKRTHQKSSRLLSSKYGRNSETKLRFINTSTPDVGADLQNDFIEFTSSRKRKRGADSPEHNGVDYRSIEGKAKASNKPADEDVEYASDSGDDEDQASDLRARQENAVLSKQAKATPLVLEPWLALAEHQSRLIRPDGEVSSFTTSERKTLAELRLSILNEAGKHISKEKAGRERLLLATIEEGVSLWDKVKLAAKWKEILKECPSSILLWTRYMDFIQYDHSSFQYETCRDAYLQWLHILKTAYEDSGGEERARICQTQLYALLRFTTFVRDAGYDELATATWQALLELHFFTPTALQGSDQESRLQSLEDYWNVETPRIGEDGSLTWAKFHESPSKVPRRPPVTSSIPDIEPSAPFLGLVQAEVALADRFTLPASTDDDDAIADPFRCILFDDLRPVIGNVTELPKTGLISAFLHFCGLPPLPNQPTAHWGTDPHIACNMRERRETTFSLFSDGFQPFRDRNGSDNEGFGRFVDRILAALVQTCDEDDDALREYFLSFKAAMFPQEATKTAKRLLKASSMSLRLYNAYALVEAHAGRLEKAMEVWDAALGMLPRLSSIAQEDAVLLWHSRFMTQVLGHDEQSALRGLLKVSQSGGEAAAEQDAEGLTAQLRLRRTLEAGFDRSVLSSQSSFAVLFADLLSWLTYLTSGRDVVAAVESYNHHIPKLARAALSGAEEELLQCKARLMGWHIDCKRPSKPSTFQKEVDDALLLFPENTELLKLGQRVAKTDRLRSLVQESKSPRKEQEIGVVAWYHKIQSEIQRVANVGMSGGTVDAVRATFGKALLSPGSNVQHARALWEEWLTFEIKHGNVRRMREVFLAGLRCIPGDKGWALAGMRSEMLEERTMRGVWEGIVERGLRVRVEGK